MTQPLIGHMHENSLHNPTCAKENKLQYLTLLQQPLITSHPLVSACVTVAGGVSLHQDPTGGTAGHNTSLIPSALGSDSPAAASVCVCLPNVQLLNPAESSGCCWASDRMSWPILLSVHCAKPEMQITC